MDQDFAAAGGIDAMPEFPRFHDHDGYPFFDCGLGGDAGRRKGLAHSKRRWTI